MLPALTAARASWGTTLGDAASSWSSWQARYWRVRFLSGPPSHGDHGSFLETGTCPRHASVYGGFEKFVLSFALARLAREIWYIISVVLYLAVIVLGVWVLLRSTENWILREMTFFVGAMLGSAVDTVHASTLAFRSISHIFYVAADSIPDCVSSPFGLNGEECPVDASGCSFAPRSSHLDHWMIFSSFT